MKGQEISYIYIYIYEESVEVILPRHNCPTGFDGLWNFHLECESACSFVMGSRWVRIHLKIIKCTNTKP
jgi:hypothetical protein